MKRLVLLILVLVAGCSQKSAPDRAPAAAAPTSENSRDKNTAAITSAAARAADIEILQTGAAQIRETLTLYGSIRPNAEHLQEIRARYPGVIRSVTKRPGDTVRKGDELISVESNDSLEPYAIRSPTAGTVLGRHVNAGQPVGTDTLLMTVCDLSSVWAEFSIFSRDLGRVRAGMNVAIRAGETDVSDEVKLTYVAPAGDADSQSVVARAVLNNAGQRWVAGQFVTGDVVISDVRAEVAIVPSALQILNDAPTVFVQTGTGFEARRVEIGHRGRDAVEILTGLAAGEKYAAKNSYLIKAELLKGESEGE